jgi:tRNA-specific 2-thiouridylase
VNWVSITPPEARIRALAKIRARHEAAPAWVIPTGDEGAPVEYDEPQPAITPGQAVVLYDEGGELLLGGGWIGEAKGDQGW